MIYAAFALLFLFLRTAIKAENKVNISFAIPRYEPQKISYVSIDAVIGKARLRVSDGLFFQKLNTDKTEATAGRSENTLFQVNTAEMMLNAKKSKSQPLLCAHFLLWFKNTPSRIIPIAAIAAPEKALRHR